MKNKPESIEKMIKFAHNSLILNGLLTNLILGTIFTLLACKFHGKRKLI